MSNSYIVPENIYNEMLRLMDEAKAKDVKNVMKDINRSVAKVDTEGLNKVIKAGSESLNPKPEAKSEPNVQPEVGEIDEST